MIGADGWLDRACRVDSPNFDARPPGTAIELIVVHNISLPPGRYGGGHVARCFPTRLTLLRSLLLQRLKLRAYPHTSDRARWETDAVRVG